MSSKLIVYSIESTRSRTRQVCRRRTRIDSRSTAGTHAVLQAINLRHTQYVWIIRRAYISLPRYAQPLSIGYYFQPFSHVVPATVTEIVTDFVCKCCDLWASCDWWQLKQTNNYNFNVLDL